MKRKLFNLLRIIAVIAVFALMGYAVMQLLTLQSAASAEACSINTLAAACTIGFVLLLLSLPIGSCLLSRMGGWRLHTLHILFVQITGKDKLRVRFVPRLGFYAHMLPPRIDGTSPWVLRLFARPIWLAGLFVLLALAAAATWRLPVCPVFIVLCGGCLGGSSVALLPTKNDALLQALRLRRDVHYRQAFECAQHISAAVAEKISLHDMPEAWFPALPAALIEDHYVYYVTYHRFGWLIDHERELEGYEALLPLLHLAPAPETYAFIAAAIINGAIVEALNDLPPRCLKLLDDPSIKYMTPVSWERVIKTALYARALFLHHDAQEAAQLLPDIEKHFTAESDRPRRTLRRLQEKAGVIPKEDAP